jgi:hypothetical protein
MNEEETEIAVLKKNSKLFLTFASRIIRKKRQGQVKKEFRRLCK